MNPAIFRSIVPATIVLVCCMLCGGDSLCQSPSSISLVPIPEKMTATKGEFRLTSQTIILSDAKSKPTAEYLADLIAPATGFRLRIESATKKKTPSAIRIKIDPGAKSTGPEGYALEVAPNTVSISAASPAGAFYAVQTLRQLLPPDIESKSKIDRAWVVPCVKILDRPRFPWRGLMLDTARHFFPKAFVLRTIDEMAAFKLNRLHLHLTDDQGWHLEIRRYPELTKIGAWREKSSSKDYFNNPSGKAHGGFYTQDDIREIVAYAAKRHITVVPEIEMPGHAQAALASRNELSCTGAKLKVLTHWGVNKEIYCAGNDETFVFLRNVLTEVAELFPGEYVHIGGDEAVKDRWRVCPKCQARIHTENLKDEAELQSWFIRRIEPFLNSKGKKLIGWDEILEGGLPPRAVVMSWRGVKGGIQAATEGHDVIMSPTSNCYIDYPQSRDGEPTSIGAAPLPMCRVYAYEPIPPQLTPDQARHILGTQGNLWTEYIETPEVAEYMFWPRAAALSEVAWSPAALRNWGSFQNRMAAVYRRFDVMGMNYRKPRDTDAQLCQ